MYDLHKLGWHSFQQLCLSIARETLGQAVESFLDSRDAGRDGAFTGTWARKDGEALTGRFVIQCKFTGKPGELRRRDLSEEVGKVHRLVAEGRCDCYILMTNAGVSGQRAEEIDSLLKSVGVKHVLVLGSTWICDQIRESKRLRMMVPRVYGLGDLSQILDERAYSQARALLATMREDLAKVVVTGTYWKAVAALDKHSFVMLIGEPAAGKTTIASLLAVAAVDQWRAPMLKLDDPRKVIEHWNTDEPSQFLWIDDAFGVTQYENYLVYGWNHILPQVKTMLRKGAKIVMTSRDYIYNRARKDLKQGAFPLLQEGQVVVDVHHLTQDDRRQILYNHLKLGRQTQAFRRQLKPHLEFVAAHAHFIPEIARRLSEPAFTESLQVSRDGLGNFVDKQEEFLQDVLQGLDNHNRAALALIYMRNGTLVSPIVLGKSELQAIERLDSTLGGCTAALEAMKDGLVQYSLIDGEAIWRFRHPTIGDAYAGLLSASPELLGIYVQGSPPEKLIAQVTCGDVGVERSVRIPKNLFPLMLDRLDDIWSTRKNQSSGLSVWEVKSRLHYFLTWRCSREFLSLYIDRHPDILREVAKPGLYLSSVSEVRLAARLHGFGLLPEDDRRTFVATVSNYALEGEDLYVFESSTIRGLYTQDEFREFRERIRDELLPQLADVRRNWESNRTYRDPSEEYMQPLIDSLYALKKEFQDEPEAILAIERQVELANEWIAENVDDRADEGPARDELGEMQQSDAVSSTRSIFDDVDE